MPPEKKNEIFEDLYKLSLYEESSLDVQEKCRSNAVLLPC